MLQFKCLKQPPVYHMGERIRARISFVGEFGQAYMPDSERGFSEQHMIADPPEGAIDPSTLEPRIPRIRVGSGGFSGASRVEIDVNEWLQFRKPGRCVLQVVLKGWMWKPDRKGVQICDMESNAESIKILPPDAKWEAAQLERLSALLESTSQDDRYLGALLLRYLNTPSAAVALARWYSGLVYIGIGDRVTSALFKGIFESQYGCLAQRELEKILRAGASRSADIARTLAAFEVRKRFNDRPMPADPDAAQKLWREISEFYASATKSYLAEAGHPVR